MAAGTTFSPFRPPPIRRPDTPPPLSRSDSPPPPEIVLSPTITEICQRKGKDHPPQTKKFQSRKFYWKEHLIASKQPGIRLVGEELEKLFEFSPDQEEELYDYLVAEKVDQLIVDHKYLGALEKTYSFCSREMQWKMQTKIYNSALKNDHYKSAIKVAVRIFPSRFEYPFPALCLRMFQKFTSEDLKESLRSITEPELRNACIRYLIELGEREKASPVFTMMLRSLMLTERAD